MFIEDARFGHKTSTSTFYGYKNQLAMTEERLIAGITITPGGDPDGRQLPDLIKKVRANGIGVTEVIGDMAYVSEDNLTACGNEITLIAKTNTAVAAAAQAKLEEGFCYNKDAGMLQCPAGELSMRVEKRAAANGNTYLRYVFSKVKCRKCPLRESCRVGKSKAKERSYSITQVSEKNQSRLEFEAGEEFQERLKIRHRIEEKNGELKEAHGLRRADSVGLFAMRLQMFQDGVYDVYLSTVTLEEVAACPEPKRSQLREYMGRISYTTLNISDEVSEVAQKIVDMGILTPKSYDDCQHIGAAVVNECDCIISWNFKHIVNIKTIHGIRAITNLEGYKNIDILSPTVLLEGEG